MDSLFYSTAVIEDCWVCEINSLIWVSIVVQFRGLNAVLLLPPFYNDIVQIYREFRFVFDESLLGVLREPKKVFDRESANGKMTFI
jgi:hypothetical protein